MSAPLSDGVDQHLDVLRLRARQLLDDEAAADFVRTRGQAQLDAIEQVHGLAAEHPATSPWTSA